MRQWSKLTNASLGEGGSYKAKKRHRVPWSMSQLQFLCSRSHSATSNTKIYLPEGVSELTTIPNAGHWFSKCHKLKDHLWKLLRMQNTPNSELFWVLTHDTNTTRLRDTGQTHQDFVIQVVHETGEGRDLGARTVLCSAPGSSHMLQSYYSVSSNLPFVREAKVSALNHWCLKAVEKPTIKRIKGWEHLYNLNQCALYHSINDYIKTKYVF